MVFPCELPQSHAKIGAKSKILQRILRRTIAGAELTGAPNKDIVQNHLTVDIGIFLSPKNFLSVRIS